MEKAKNLTLHKIKIPEQIEMKFGTADYDLKIYSQTKLCDNLTSGGFWEIHEIYERCDFLIFPQPTWWPDPPTDNCLTSKGQMSRSQHNISNENVITR